ncbi:MAG: hypothetical protein AAGG38_08605 [Planctomycetota bacterium]
MFKFFRQYNKIILVVGGCVLMVAFLVPQAVEMFGPNPAKETIGRAHGEKITRGDAESAEAELRFLSNSPFRAGLLTDDRLHWLLMQRDAASMGIWASDREVDVALESMGYTQELLAEQAGNLRTTVGTIREIVRRWLISEQYRQVLEGTAYRDPRGGSLSLAVNRIQTFSQVIQQLSQFGPIPPQFEQQALEIALRQANGTRRLSGPMLRRFMRDNYAFVQGRVVMVRPEPQAAAEPTEAELSAVFEQYKDVLPGQGEPYPFGYQYPDRVKLTYLRVPTESVREQASVEYVDVLEAYRANPQRFADTEGEAPATPTPEAARTLREELVAAEAERLAQRIVAKVQGLLAESVRGFATQEGYVELPEDFEPTPWVSVVEAVRAEHGVQLDVLGDADQWVAVDELRGLGGIGFSALGGGSGVGFTQYVANTRQLAAEPELVPRSQRSQVGVASKPLRGLDGHYFFRLHEVQAQHAPESLDEVRDQVVADARTIAAFEKLKTETESWAQMAIAEGLDKVAEAAGEGASVTETPRFQKVATAEGDAPRVPGVGSSRAFVDAAFGLVESAEGQAAEVASWPEAERTVVVPVPGAADGPALAVFVLDGYEPLTRSGYEQAIESGGANQADTALITAAMQSPLSLNAVARRVGFDLEAYEN